MSIGNLSIAAAPGTPFNGNPSATMTITDTGSSVTLTPNSALVMGDVFADAATVNVQNNGVLTVGAGGSSSIYAGSSLNINGGTVDSRR